MKKLIYSAATLALAFFAASCQQENLEPVGGNTVTYTVQVPDALSTKALGDELKANTLIYEVYRKADIDDLTKSPVYEGTADVNAQGVATLQLEFIKNQNFIVLFWAQYEDQNEEQSEYVSPYTTTDLRQVTLNTSLISNDTLAAVFAGVDTVSDCLSSVDGYVTLTRPIAQLNIATSEESLSLGNTDVDLYDVNCGSYLKVTGLSTTYNVATKAAGTDKSVFEYAKAAIPRETIEVNGTEYTYVAMNYVGFASDAATVDTEFSIYTSEGEIKHKVNNVPVKPNYRTNIIGNLITATSDYIVTIHSDWTTPSEEKYVWNGDPIEVEPTVDAESGRKHYTIANIAELVWLQQEVNKAPTAFSNTTIEFVSNIDLEGMEWTPINLATIADRPEKSTLVKGNGYTISNFTITGGKKVGFISNMRGNIDGLNLKDVNIYAEGTAGALVGQTYGNITNCSAKNVNIVMTCEMVNGQYEESAKGGALVGQICEMSSTPFSVKGCTVENATIYGYRELGSIVGYSNSPLTFENNSAKDVTIIVDQWKHIPYEAGKTQKYDKFVGNRPGEYTATEDNVNIWLEKGEGCRVNGNLWTVANAAALQIAVDGALPGKNTTINFIDNIAGVVTIVERPDVDILINGYGKKYDGTIKLHSGSERNNCKVKFENINFESSVKENEFIQALEFTSNERYSQNITVENCSFTAIAGSEAEKTAVAIKVESTQNLNVKQCTGTNLHSFLQAQSCDANIVVDEVTVTESKNGISFGNTAAPTIKNSTINTLAYGIRGDGNGRNCTLAVEDCAVTSSQPIIIRRVQPDTDGSIYKYDVVIEGTTLTTEEQFQVIFTKNSDSDPYEAPTAEWDIDDEDAYNVYPRNYNGDPVIENGQAVDGVLLLGNTYSVSNAAGFKWLATKPQHFFSGKTIKLIADIDFNYDNLTPINFGVNGDIPGVTFDGQNHTLSRLMSYQYVPDYGNYNDNQALFNGKVDIKNLKVDSAGIYGRGYSGVIGGTIYGSLENCHVSNSGIENYFWQAGGLVGQYRGGSIKGCTVTSTRVYSYGAAGALVGLMGDETGHSGPRVFENCSVSDCSVQYRGSIGYDWENSFGAVVGWVYLDNTVVKIFNCNFSNNMFINQSPDQTIELPIYGTVESTSSVTIE